METRPSVSSCQMKLQEVVQTYTIKSQSTTSSVELGKGRWETEVKKRQLGFKLILLTPRGYFLPFTGDWRHINCVKLSPL